MLILLYPLQFKADSSSCRLAQAGVNCVLHQASRFGHIVLFALVSIRNLCATSASWVLPMRMLLLCAQHGGEVIEPTLARLPCWFSQTLPILIVLNTDASALFCPFHALPSHTRTLSRKVPISVGS